MSTIPEWLTTQPTLIQRTEATVPLSMGIGPVWPHPNGPAAWYAFITVEGFPDRLWECEHEHPTLNEAWDCAMGRLLASDRR